MLKPIKIDKELMKQLQKAEKEKKKKEFFEKPEEKYIPTTELPSCVIIDIDGTVAINWGRDYLDFNNSDKDTICVPVRHVINLIKLEGKHKVILLTGREDKWKIITEKWLSDHAVKYDLLLMRATGDHRADYIIKKEIFDAAIRNKYSIFFAFEDRKQVKKMWVRLGVFVFDCNQIDEVF